MTSNFIFEYTTDQAIADGVLMEADALRRPEAPRFPLGRLIITTNAFERLTPEEVAEALARHAAGDWGTICQDDAGQNDGAIAGGDRLLSSYPGNAGTFWIITEADRSATTVLMPEDY